MKGIKRLYRSGIKYSNGTIRYNKAVVCIVESRKSTGMVKNHFFPFKKGINKENRDTISNCLLIL